MGHLVHDEIGDLGLAVARHEGEEGIGEPAEGREGVDRPGDDVEALLLEAGGFLFRVLGVEVAAVGHLADDRVGPEVAREGELGAGLDDGGEAVGVEHDHRGVVLRLLEAEVLRGRRRARPAPAR